MPDEYIYHEPTGPTFSGPLPEGQYPFSVISVEAGYTSKAGNFVLPVKLAVGSDKVHVYDNPSAGVSGKGAPYDNIAAFLKSIRRNPKNGERADLSEKNLVGARGELMLKVEIAQKGGLIGKPVNKVHFYIWNISEKGLAPAAQGQVDPDNIPF